MPNVLKLSPYVLPQVRQGMYALTAQCLTDGTLRFSYARALVATLQQMIAMGAVEAAQRFRTNMPMGEQLTQWHESEGQVSVALLADAENVLGANPEGRTIILADGRIRNDEDVVQLPTGTETAGYMEALQQLHRGCSREALMALAEAKELGIDDELVDDMLASGILEEVPAADPPVNVNASPGVMWFGHAFVHARSGAASVWVDPFTLPKIAWSEEERGAFRADVPDTFLQPNYGPDGTQVTLDQLPTPDAVFITHQDVDHCDFGVLGLLPPTVPIYVPEHLPHPWLVDMVKVIKEILGADRTVKVVRHGETVEVGDIKVTAFPFVGEFPTALAHRWNCYYLELPNQCWALTADSAVTDEQVGWLAARREGDSRPFGVMTNIVHAGSPVTAGYRDSFLSTGNGTRLYSWFLPPIGLLEPEPAVGLSVEAIAALVARAGLSRIFPYAHGNLPWFRITSCYVLRSLVGSHTLEDFALFERLAKRAGATLARFQHGVWY